MKVAAIIAEYNPFHNGHAYQIAETRKLTGADYVLVLMSGDFVQRGAPAIFNKYIRTKMALLGGADAVLELPSLYATASAEFFAGGGVTLFHQLGVVDYLSFGSECGNLTALQSCARFLTTESAEYQKLLSEYLKQGLSFPAARQQALSQFMSDAASVRNLFESPNNILALEYCKSLLALHSSICPITIKRLGDAYHTSTINKDDSVFSSASAIRGVIEHAKNTEHQTIINSYPSEFLTVNDFSTLLHYKLLSERETGFTKYLDCNTDLSDKIIKHLPEYADFTTFCILIKSKDLTYTRISRVLTHILLNLTTPDSFRAPFCERTLTAPYARLLGFKKDSTPLLSAIKKSSSIPLISKLADAPSLLENDSSNSHGALQMLKQDILVSDIYESVFAQKYNKRPSVNEYRQSPVII